MQIDHAPDFWREGRRQRRQGRGGIMLDREGGSGGGIFGSIVLCHGRVQEKGAKSAHTPAQELSPGVCSEPQLVKEWRVWHFHHRVSAASRLNRALATAVMPALSCRPRNTWSSVALRSRDSTRRAPKFS